MYKGKVMLLVVVMDFVSEQLLFYPEKHFSNHLCYCYNKNNKAYRTWLFDGSVSIFCSSCLCCSLNSLKVLCEMKHEQCSKSAIGSCEGCVSSCFWSTPLWWKQWNHLTRCFSFTPGREHGWAENQGVWLIASAWDLGTMAGILYFVSGLVCAAICSEGLHCGATTGAVSIQ